MEKLIDLAPTNNNTNEKKVHIFQYGNPIAWCGSRDKLGVTIDISKARKTTTCETCLQKLESRGF